MPRSACPATLTGRTGGVRLCLHCCSTIAGRHSRRAATDDGTILIDLCRADGTVQRGGAGGQRRYWRTCRRWREAARVV